MVEEPGVIGHMIAQETSVEKVEMQHWISQLQITQGIEQRFTRAQVKDHSIIQVLQTNVTSEIKDLAIQQDGSKESIKCS